jgi:hypothetical protein
MTSRRVFVLASLAGAAVAIGCSDDAPPVGPNPPRLWLALDGSEVEVKLSPVEPPPF